MAKSQTQLVDNPAGPGAKSPRASRKCRYTLLKRLRPSGISILTKPLQLLHPTRKPRRALSEAKVRYLVNQKAAIGTPSISIEEYVFLREHNPSELEGIQRRDNIASHAAMFLVDYRKWPEYIASYTAKKGRHPPILMPLLVICEVLLYAVCLISSETGTFTVNVLRLDFTKPYQFWRWFTFLGIGSTWNLVVNLAIHVTFGGALEIYNGTKSLIAVHASAFAAVWGAAVTLYYANYANLGPLVKEVHEGEAELRMLLWIGFYAMILTNVVMNRPIVSLYSCGAFLIAGFLLSLPWFTSQHLWMLNFSAFLASLLVAFLVLPKKSYLCGWKKQLMVGCGVTYVFYVIASVVGLIEEYGKVGGAVAAGNNRVMMLNRSLTLAVGSGRKNGSILGWAWS